MGTKSKRSTRSTPTTIIPFTNLPRRTQILLGILGICMVFATVYFAGTDASLASISN